MHKRKQRVVFLADCQSFYASVEKRRIPHTKTDPGRLRRPFPAQRHHSRGMPACEGSRGHHGGAPVAGQQKCPDLVVMKPRMSAYIRVSLQIMSILESYSDLVEPFSIDEQFIDVTASLAHFGCTPKELARHIQMRVRRETGVYTRVGIGRNKVLAKLACDNLPRRMRTASLS